MTDDDAVLFDWLHAQRDLIPADMLAEWIACDPSFRKRLIDFAVAEVDLAASLREMEIDPPRRPADRRIGSGRHPAAV